MWSGTEWVKVLININWNLLNCMVLFLIYWKPKVQTWKEKKRKEKKRRKKKRKKFGRKRGGVSVAQASPSQALKPGSPAFKGKFGPTHYPLSAPPPPTDSKVRQCPQGTYCSSYSFTEPPKKKKKKKKKRNCVLSHICIHSNIWQYYR